MVTMAKLTRDDVLKLARLARLDLTDDEIEEFSGELSEILQYVEQLSTVDVKGLEPTNQVTGLTNVMRDDEVKDYGYEAADLLKNVPQTKDDLIKVKRMLGCASGCRLLISPPKSRLANSKPPTWSSSRLK
jgi:aspartyl-tRNA(Asn)/glutamyl-tRNA(Gln) amidotransferase subunit C